MIDNGDKIKRTFVRTWSGSWYEPAYALTHKVLPAALTGDDVNLFDTNGEAIVFAMLPLMVEMEEAVRDCEREAKRCSS